MFRRALIALTTPPRVLLSAGVALSVLGLLGADVAEAATGLPIETVAPGVYAHIGALEDWGPANGGDVSNMGFVVGARCIAVIDTGGTPAVGAAWRAAIEAVSSLPICYVIHTHAHPDHMLGDIAFRAPSTASSSSSPQFVASDRYAATLAARRPYYLAAVQREFGITLAPEAIVFPDQRVTETLTLDLGDRLLTLRSWPTAHTDNDLTVYDAQTRTLFTGDLLFVRHLPALDGSLRGWLAALTPLASMNVAHAVPGHGPVAHQWPAPLSAENAYLTGLLRDTRAALKAGWTIQQAVDRIPAPTIDPPWLVVDRFQRRNVTAAFAELEWEDEPPPGKETMP